MLHIQIITLAIILVFLPTYSNAKLNSKKQRKPAQATTSTPNSLSDTTIFRIPENCYSPVPTDYTSRTVMIDADRSNDTHGFRTLFVVQDRDTDLQKPFVFLKNSCIQTINQHVQETNERYLFNDERLITFPYNSSRPRSYCGIDVPSDQLPACPLQLPVDLNAISKIDATKVPPVLEDIIDAIQNNTRPSNDVIDRYQFLLTPDKEVRRPEVTGVLHGERLRRLRIARLLRGRVKKYTLLEGYVTYVRQKPIALTQSVSDSSITQIFQTVQAGSGRGRNATRENPALTQFAQLADMRTERLRRYWFASISTISQASFEELISWAEPPNANDSSFDTLLAIKRALNNGSLSYEDLNHAIAIAMENISAVISRTSNTETLITAAARWWSLRGLQIQFSCAGPENAIYADLTRSEESPVNAAAEIMLRDQPVYQKCRRQYTNLAFTILNRSIQQNTALRLDDQAWLLAKVFGSRSERIQMYERALDVLWNQVTRGVYLTTADYRAITFEIMQLNKEFTLHKSLTWNGYQNMTSEEADKVQHLLNHFREFMTETTRYLYENRMTAYDAFDLHRLNWNAVAEVIHLPIWNEHIQTYSGGTRDQASVLNEFINSIENGIPATVSAETITSLYRSMLDINLGGSATQSTTPQNELNLLARPFPAAEDQRLCRAFISLAKRVRERTGQPVFVASNIDTLTAFEGSCIPLTLAWFSDPTEVATSDLAELETKCRSGHSLSCATHHILSSTPLRLNQQEWISVLSPTLHYIPPSVFKQLVTIFFAEAIHQNELNESRPTPRGNVRRGLRNLSRRLNQKDAGAGGESEANLLTWREVIIQIHRSILESFVNSLPTAPNSTADLDRFFSGEAQEHYPTQDHLIFSFIRYVKWMGKILELHSAIPRADLPRITDSSAPQLSLIRERIRRLSFRQLGPTTTNANQIEFETLSRNLSSALGSMTFCESQTVEDRCRYVQMIPELWGQRSSLAF